MACEEKSRLILEFDDAAKAYHEAVMRLTERMGTTTKDHYEEIKRASEDAWLKCEQARLALEWHTSTHNC
jgi:hypothetical protein